MGAEGEGGDGSCDGEERSEGRRLEALQHLDP